MYCDHIWSSQVTRTLAKNVYSFLTSKKWPRIAENRRKMSFFKLKCKKVKKKFFRRKLRVLWVTEDDRKVII